VRVDSVTGGGGIAFKLPTLESKAGFNYKEKIDGYYENSAPNP
jgi:hypothetical protein